MVAHPNVLCGIMTMNCNLIVVCIMLFVMPHYELRPHIGGHLYAICDITTMNCDLIVVVYSNVQCDITIINCNLIVVHIIITIVDISMVHYDLRVVHIRSFVMPQPWFMTS